MGEEHRPQTLARAAGKRRSPPGEEKGGRRTEREERRTALKGEGEQQLGGEAGCFLRLLLLPHPVFYPLLLRMRVT